MEAQRAILDALMGKDRNILSTTQSEYSWHSEGICKYYVTFGYCPYILFSSTKSYSWLGNYKHNYKHELLYRRQFLVDKQNETNLSLIYRYESLATGYLEYLVFILDSKIQANILKQLTVLPTNNNTLSNNNITILMEITNNIIITLSALISLIDYNNDFNINTYNTSLYTEEILDLKYSLINLLSEQKTMFADNNLLYIDNNNNDFYYIYISPPNTTTNNKPICPICSVSLNCSLINNKLNISNNSTHLGGKQHIGWQQIRDSLEQYKNTKPSYNFNIRKKRYNK